MNKTPYYLDLPVGDTTIPGTGDFLVSPHSTWRIEYSRQTDSQLSGNRWTLYLTRTTHYRGTFKVWGGLSNVGAVDLYATDVETALDRALRKYAP